MACLAQRTLLSLCRRFCVFRLLAPSGVLADLDYSILTGEPLPIIAFLQRCFVSFAVFFALIKFFSFTLLSYLHELNLFAKSFSQFSPSFLTSSILNQNLKKRFHKSVRFLISLYLGFRFTQEKLVCFLKYPQQAG